MGRVAACAVVLASRAGGLYLDVPVDGRVLTIEYEASNTYTELWRYAEAFEAEHGLRRFYDQWAKCAPVIYARYKCVTSEILKAMQAHRDAAHGHGKANAPIERGVPPVDTFNAASLIVDGKVVIGSTDGRLRVLGLKDGAVLWQRDLGAPILGAAAITQGQVVTATTDGHLRAFGPKAP